MKPVLVLVLSLGVTLADNVACSTWTDCWTCADNSDAEFGGCSWDGSTCSESAAGTTDATECDDIPESTYEAYMCEVMKSDDCATDLCCSDYWECLYSAISDYSGFSTTDSTTGDIFTYGASDASDDCAAECGSADYCVDSSDDGGDDNGGDGGGDDNGGDGEGGDDNGGSGDDDGDGNMNCDVWTECWSCADNSDADFGGCSWDGSVCTQSDTGTTDPADCKDIPDEAAAQASCNSDFGASCTDAKMCCQNYWDCLFDAIDRYGSLSSADSTTGEIVSLSSSQAGSLCRASCPKLDCTGGAGMFSTVVSLALTALTVFFMSKN